MNFNRMKNTRAAQGIFFLGLLALCAMAGLGEKCGANDKTTSQVPDPDAVSKLECGQNPAFLGKAPLMAWAKSGPAWNALYAKLHSNSLPAPTPPPVNLEKFGVLLIYAGQYNTGGYSLLFGGGGLDGTTLSLTVNLKEPPPGQITTQSLTAPYCLILIEKQKVQKIIIDSNLPFPQKIIVLNNFPEFSP